MKPGSLRWWFENRETGEITLAQIPNPPLWIGLASWTVGRVFGGAIGAVAGVVTFAALVWWALDEIVRGVNPWRKALGTAVLFWQLTAVLT
ncbi:MAG: hypothetical protein AAF548_14715 [Actinomycetota bacterium]